MMKNIFYLRRVNLLGASTFQYMACRLVLDLYFCLTVLFHYKKKRYKIIHAEINVKSHKKYLSKIGFIEVPINKFGKIYETNLI